LINNRQGGRRRGRGGQGGRNLGGQPGNRQDNRQRGNAAQLLEKYKSMARDAQLAGDRVQTEYFLQFADHYFRVLGESRSRFEEQNPGRQRDNEMDYDDGDEDQAEVGEGTSADERPERPDRPERAEPREYHERTERQNRGQRFNRVSRPRPDDREDAGNRDAGESEDNQMNGGGETIPFDVLPPAIGRDDPETAQPADDEPRRPRRRARTPRAAEGEDEVAPAA